MTVLVNGIALSDAEVAFLSRIYGDIATGRYWYDPVSGLYGLEGGPATGRIQANLRLGGPLRADASGGGSGVFVNGRELSPAERARMKARSGFVPAGRYWLDPRGRGGIEGGPPRFDWSRATTSAGDRRLDDVDVFLPEIGPSFYFSCNGTSATARW